jgi:uncharacterized Ntn-hydrolase superfamily protein
LAVRGFQEVKRVAQSALLTEGSGVAVLALALQAAVEAGGVAEQEQTEAVPVQPPVVEVHIQ